jgi:hypothetical protein
MLGEKPIITAFSPFPLHHEAHRPFTLHEFTDRNHELSHSLDVCGQMAVDSVVVESEFFVIQAQQLRNGGVEVVPVNGIFVAFQPMSSVLPWVSQLNRGLSAIGPPLNISTDKLN